MLGAPPRVSLHHLSSLLHGFLLLLRPRVARLPIVRENPSLIFVSNVLDGPKYHQWSCSICMSLVFKIKLSFINNMISALIHVNSLHLA
ncbi:hypothetical protein CR513_10032, partial [Mucuna pruriens]